LADDRSSVRHYEGQVFAARAEGEVCVEVAGWVDGTVSRGKHDQILARGEYNAGECPLIEVGGRVGQVPAAEVDRGVAGVENFDPIGRVAVAVG
jgi:hypothetical protein